MKRPTVLGAVLIVFCGLLLSTTAYAEVGFLISCNKSMTSNGSTIYIGKYRMASGNLVTRIFNSSCPGSINT